MGLTFNIKSLGSLSGILKLVELGLAVICIILLRHYMLNFGTSSWLDSSSLFDRSLVGHIAIGSSILISFVLVFGYVFFAHSSNLMENLFCLSAASLNVAGGALAIETYKDQNHDNKTVQAGLAMGSLMIINSMVYMADCVTGTIQNRK